MTTQSSDLRWDRSPTRSGNRILSGLNVDEIGFLSHRANTSEFSRGDILVEADSVAKTVYFVERGIASTVKPKAGDRRTEICLIGPEGLVGAAVVQGDGRWPYETFVQSDRLVAFGVDAAAVCELFDCSAPFRSAVLRALHAQTVQIAENLVAAAWQPIQARLARWLLMYHDRAGTPLLEVTHEFMAIMVAAERARVTVAVHELEATGAIAAMRGRVMLRDRAILERLADGTYGCAEQEAARLQGNRSGH